MERIYFQATPGQCDWAFRQLIAQNSKSAVIPGTGGLMPELSMPIYYHSILMEMESSLHYFQAVL